MKLSDLKDGMVTLDAAGDFHLVMYGKWMISDGNGHMTFDTYNEDMESVYAGSPHVRDIVAVWEPIEMTTNLKCHVYNHIPIWIRDENVLAALEQFPCPCQVCTEADFCGIREEDYFL